MKIKYKKRKKSKEKEKEKKKHVYFKNRNREKKFFLDSVPNVHNVISSRSCDCCPVSTLCDRKNCTRMIFHALHSEQFLVLKTIIYGKYTKNKSIRDKMTKIIHYEHERMVYFFVTSEQALKSPSFAEANIVRANSCCLFLEKELPLTTFPNTHCDTTPVNPRKVCVQYPPATSNTRSCGERERR